MVTVVSTRTAMTSGALGRALCGALCALAASASGCSSAKGNPPPPSEAAPTDDLHLPDPLVRQDGRAVTSPSEWAERRTELLELFRAQVYGRAPGRPEQLAFSVVEEDRAAIGGTATLRRIAIKSTQGGREHTFTLSLFVPNASGKRSGVILLLSTHPPSATDPTRAVKNEYWPVESVLARGYGMAALQADDLAPDDKATFTNGAIRLFEGEPSGARPPDAWKALSAWSWGASRAMDYLVTDPAVDPARVAVLGHSRSGKAALWAGAQDERFSLTISNESGCGGAALSRRPVGETVDLVNAVYPHWFADNFRAYNGNEAALPVDQHELLALLAPRAAVVASASEDTWSDPEGEYLGLAYASPVYALWGLPPVPLGGMPAVGESIFVAPRSYHLRAGTHALTQFDWDRYVDVADKVWASSPAP
jgi:hypothetical protein